MPPLLLGGQLGRSRLGGDASSVGRNACGEFDDVSIDDDGAVLVVADVIGLLVIDAGDGSGLVLDLPLQPEELLGVQVHDARVGGDLGGAS